MQMRKDIWLQQNWIISVCMLGYFWDKLSDKDWKKTLKPKNSEHLLCLITKFKLKKVIF